MIEGRPGNATGGLVTPNGLDFMDSHDPFDAMLAAGFTRLAQVTEYASCPLDATPGTIGIADQDPTGAGLRWARSDRGLFSH